MPEQHTILGGKVYVYKRPHSSLWQCSTYWEIAEDWYLKRAKNSAPERSKPKKTFREVSAHYLHEYDTMNQGQRTSSPISFLQFMRVILFVGGRALRS